MFLLAADAVECFIQFGALVLFLVLTFGGYIAQQLAEAKKRRDAQQQLRLPPDEAANAAAREIDEFLRQASRHADAPNAPSATSASSRPVAANVVDPYADRSAPSSQPPPRTLPSVATNVSTTALTRHASALGEEVSQADERMDEHVHERFDHSVGLLGDSSDAIHEDPNKEKLPSEAVTAGEVVDILRNPTRIREAIVLNEILTRPNW